MAESPAPRNPQPFLGRRLKALRVTRGLSLKDVSAKTGLSTSFLSMVETGRHELTVGRLVSLLAAWHNGGMKPASVRFDSGAELSVDASPAGPEFALLLSGELRIDFPDDTTIVLREGDSVCFEGSRRHRCMNTGDGEAHVITFKNEQL